MDERTGPSNTPDERGANAPPPPDGPAAEPRGKPPADESKPATERFFRRTDVRLALVTTVLSGLIALIPWISSMLGGDDACAPARIDAAIDQLASVDPMRRSNAISRLQRLAGCGAESRRTIRDRLSALIRVRAPLRRPCVAPNDSVASADTLVMGVADALTVLATLGRATGAVSPIDLRRTDLRGVVVDSAWLQNVDLRHACLAGASLHAARLIGVRLDSARLDAANLVGARLWRSTFVGAAMPGARLDSVELAPDTLVRRLAAAGGAGQGAAADFRGAHMARTQWGNAVLPGVDFTGADLTRAELHGAHLHCAELWNATLDSAALSGTKLLWANLTHASLVGASYLDEAAVDSAYLVDATLDPSAREAAVARAAIGEGSPMTADAWAAARRAACARLLSRRPS